MKNLKTNRLETYVLPIIAIKIKKKLSQNDINNNVSIIIIQQSLLKVHNIERADLTWSWFLFKF